MFLKQIAENEEIEMDLHTATSLRNLYVVSKLLKRGKDVNEKNKSDWTPIMYACSKNYLNVVIYLLKHGANKHVFDSNGRTPFILATKAGRYSTAVEVYVDELIDWRDEFGKCALTYAVERKRFQIAKYILQQGVSSKTRNQHFILAMELNQINMALLILRGVDEDQREPIIEPEFGSTCYCNISLEETLQSLGLEKYLKNFKENHVSFQEFLEMTEDDMRRIGISKFGPRRRLFLAILELKADYCNISIDL